MISRIRGEVLAAGGTWIDIELSGFGLRVLCTPATAAGARPGETVAVHTSLVVREDSLTLYGFASSEERDLFEVAQSASGIGPRIALAICSVFTPADFAAAVRADNTSAVTKVPGIGAKGAAKLVLELKDKVLGFAATSGASNVPLADEGWRDQVRGGLEGLGYSSRDADLACERVSDLVAADPDISVAILLRAALRSLAK